MPTLPDLIEVFIPTLGVVTVLMLMASGVRLIEITSNGGSTIAQRLGGKLVSTNTSKTKYRQLLNIVEEMSIASGIPVPQFMCLRERMGLTRSRRE